MGGSLQSLVRHLALVTVHIHLGPISKFPASNTKEYTVELHGQSIDLFVVKQDEHYYAYRNQCPHTGVNLNWQPDVFLSFDGQHIQCALHGALFRIDNGYCEYGPCLGRSLQTITVETSNNELFAVFD